MGGVSGQRSGHGGVRRVWSRGGRRRVGRTLSLVKISFLSIIDSLTTSGGPGVVLVLTSSVQTSKVGFLKGRRIRAPGLSGLTKRDAIFAGTRVVNNASKTIDVPDQTVLVAKGCLCGLRGRKTAVPGSRAVVNRALRGTNCGAFRANG